MSVNGDLIGDDALTAFAASSNLSTSQKNALRVLLRSIGYSVDIHAAAGTPGPQGPTGPTGATGPQGPAGVDAFTPAYASVWASSDSIASTNHDIFAASSYSSGSLSSLGATSGVTHDPATGRFTVSASGAYRVTASVPLMAATSSLMTIQIRKNGGIYTSVDHFIHTAVDPMSTTVDVIIGATAGQYFECVVTSPATHIVKKGTSMTIVRVG